MSRNILHFTYGEIKMLASLVQAGITLVDALHYICDQQSISRRKKEYMQELIHDIELGNNFIQGFDKTNIGTHSLYKQLLISASANGSLPSALIQIADHMQESSDRKSQIISIAIYPLIVTLITILLSLALLIFIIPNILPIISMNAGGQPLITKVLIFSSSLLRVHYIKICLYIALLTVLICTGYFVPRIKSFFEIILLKTPGICTLIEVICCSGYALSLYYFSSSTTDVPEVFNKISRSTKVLVFKNEFEKITESIRAGLPVSVAIIQSQYLPREWALYMKIAEESSSYAGMFQKLYIFYQMRFDRIVKITLKLAEPILMVVIGSIVGVIAYGILSPIYGLINNLR